MIYGLCCVGNWNEAKDLFIELSEYGVQLVSPDMGSDSLDDWRNYFKKAKGDIFDVINHAILLASLDCPNELKQRRCGIVENLFTFIMSSCSASANLIDGCGFEVLSNGGKDGEGLTNGKRDGFKFKEDGCGIEPASGGEDEDAFERLINEIECNGDGCEFQFQPEAARCKGDVDAFVGLSDEETNKFLCTGDECGFEFEPETAGCKGDEYALEAVTDEKLNGPKSEASVIKDGKLKDTDIVNQVMEMKDILLHNIKEDESASVLFETLMKLRSVALSKPILEVTGIGKVVNRLRKHKSEKIKNVAKTLISLWMEVAVGWLNASNENTTSEQPPPKQIMEANPENNGVNNQQITKQNNQAHTQLHAIAKNKQVKRIKTVVKPSDKLSNANSRRPPKQYMRPTLCNLSKHQYKSEDQVLLQVKFENTKRKLHDSYQRAENAKKQRTTKILDFHDLPMQGTSHRNPHSKSKTTSRIEQMNKQRVKTSMQYLP